MGYLDLADRSWPVLNRVFGAHQAIYRASRGWVGKRIPGIGPPIVLVDHVGAKSGKKRTTALLGIPVPDSADDDYFIVASKGGYPKTPAWFYNLRANPETTMRIGREVRAVRAREAMGQERDRLYRAAIRLYRPYKTYQARTDRTIPVVVLERRT
ncbi:MAG TPA: nitroreductase/quinone reductase family protein [Solirubrobacterales bacterium]|nr:nitroreductase/quinone reductase family protein [Solirubrobacterales bacterium]